jgi:uncharacterized protein (TIGR02266 family)
MTKSSGDDRKRNRAPRVSAVVPVHYRCESLDEFVAEYSADISMSGLFIRTDHPLKVDSRVHLRITLPDGSRLIEGIGRVARVGLGLRGEMGMGVEYVEFDAESMAIIEKLVEARLAKGAKAR